MQSCIYYARQILYNEAIQFNRIRCVMAVLPQELHDYITYIQEIQSETESIEVKALKLWEYMMSMTCKSK